MKHQRRLALAQPFHRARVAVLCVLVDEASECNIPIPGVEPNFI